eukprot:scaffold3304_cov73-Isochrysis_galbana.AAC.1
MRTAEFHGTVNEEGAKGEMLYTAPCPPFASSPLMTVNGAARLGGPSCRPDQPDPGIERPIGNRTPDRKWNAGSETERRIAPD